MADCLVRVILPVTSGVFLRDQVPALFNVKTALMSMVVSAADAPVAGQTMKIVGRDFGPVAKVQFVAGGASCTAVLRADQFMNREADFLGRITEYELAGFEADMPFVVNSYRIEDSEGEFKIVPMSEGK